MEVHVPAVDRVAVQLGSSTEVAQQGVDRPCRGVEVTGLDAFEGVPQPGGDLGQFVRIRVADLWSTPAVRRQHVRDERRTGSHARGLERSAVRLPWGQPVDQADGSLEQCQHVTVESHLTSHLSSTRFVPVETWYDSYAQGTELAIQEKPDGLPRDVRVLVLARTVNRLGAFSLPFLSLQLTREQGASLPTVGVVLAAFGVATMASRLLGGWLADWWGRRATMAAGLVACGATQLAIALSVSLTSAAISVVALGLAFEIYESPSQALIADSVDGRGRATAFGLLGASLSTAALLAGLMAAVLAPVSLRLLFVVDAATCFAAGVMVLGLLPRDVPTQAAMAGVRDAPRPWRNSSLVFLFAANVVFAACYLQVGISLPLTLEHRGVAASGYGVILVTSSVVVIAAQPLLRIRRRHASSGTTSPHPAPVIAGYLLLAIGLAGYGQAHTLTGFVVATAVGGMGEVLLAGHVLAMVSALAPAAHRGRYLAAFGLSWGVAATVGPVPAALLLEHAGDLVLWTAAAGCCAAVAVAHAVMLGRKAPG